MATVEQILQTEKEESTQGETGWFINSSQASSGREAVP